MVARFEKQAYSISLVFADVCRFGLNRGTSDKSQTFGASQTKIGADGSLRVRTDPGARSKT